MSLSVSTATSIWIYASSSSQKFNVAQRSYIVAVEFLPVQTKGLWVPVQPHSTERVVDPPLAAGRANLSHDGRGLNESIASVEIVPIGYDPTVSVCGPGTLEYS